mmetsp:Transcript_24300/g.61824  ORF Transcript_24300/g.61824 Transcript_24300/m.61824 type:complete len:353 (-) Transcript_24300:869-1927(-)
MERRPASHTPCMSALIVHTSPCPALRREVHSDAAMLLLPAVAAWGALRPRASSCTQPALAAPPCTGVRAHDATLMPCSSARISCPVMRPPPARSASSLAPPFMRLRTARGPPRSPSCSFVSCTYAPGPEYGSASTYSDHRLLASSERRTSALNVVVLASSHAATSALAASSTSPMPALRCPLTTPSAGALLSMSRSGSGAHSASEPPALSDAPQPDRNSGVTSPSTLELSMERSMRSARVCSVLHSGRCSARCSRRCGSLDAASSPSMTLLPADSSAAITSAVHTRWLPTAGCGLLLYCTVTSRGSRATSSSSVCRWFRHALMCGRLPSMASWLGPPMVDSSRCSTMDSCCR